MLLTEEKVEELKRYIADKNVPEIKKIMEEYDLEIKDGKIFPKDIVAYKKESAFWKLSQQIRKIALNSGYGCLLQASSKWYDKRMGASTTLTGRCITRHMASYINEMVTGVYKIYGETMQFGDTDSTYFSVYDYFNRIKEQYIKDPEGTIKELTIIKDGKVVVDGQKKYEMIKNFQFTTENVKTLYDNIQDKINESFPEFMMSHFNVDHEHGEIIKCGREIVAETGLVVCKKHYGLLLNDDDGYNVENEEYADRLKIRGLDVLRSDNSAEMKSFLKQILIMILTNKTKDDVEKYIKDFKKKFDDQKPWEKGSPKSVKDLKKYQDLLKLEEQKDNGNLILSEFSNEALGQKVALPGNIQASLNWNKMVKIKNDRKCSEITNGTRIVVCKLKDNSYGFQSIAIPYDQDYIPEWFKELPFDVEKMTNSVLLKKIENLTKPLKWKFNLDKNDEIFDNFFSED